jgi:hypothetical protein
MIVEDKPKPFAFFFLVLAFTLRLDIFLILCSEVWRFGIQWWPNDNPAWHFLKFFRAKALTLLGLVWLSFC